MDDTRADMASQATGDASRRPRLPDAFRSAATALAMLDLDLRFVEVNPVFAQTAGSTVDGLLGVRITDLWHVDPPDGPSLLDRLRAEASFTVDARPTDPNGIVEPASFMFIEQSDMTVFAGQIAVVMVPTESLEQQRLFSTGGSGFQLSFDQVDVGMVIFGMDGAIAHINDAMCRMLGRTREEIGSVDASYVHPDDRQAAMEAAIRTLSGESDAWKLEKRCFHADGHIIWVLESTTLVRDGAGRPLHFLGQFVDISDRKAAEAELRASEARVTFLADGLPVAVIEMGDDGVVRGGNAPLVELLGFDPTGRRMVDLLDRGDASRAQRAFDSSVHDGSDWRVEFRVRRHDGELRWVRSVARTHVDADGRFRGAIATWTDVTNEVDARRASERFAELLESVEDVVAITDADGVVLHVNAAGRANAAAGDHRLLADLFPSTTPSTLLADALAVARSEGQWQGEVVLDEPGEQTRTLSLSLVAHRGPRGSVEFLSAITRDITDLKRAEERLRIQATTDALTGLHNRTILFDRLTLALARTNRHGGGVAVLFVDLDHFKPVNDEHGHDAGDQVLVEVGRRLLQSVRECDTVARMGGDEFVAICEPMTRAEDALIVAQRVVQNLAEPYDMPFGTVHISASVGMVMSTEGSTPQSLVRDADMATYRAKANGRAQVVFS